MTRSEHDRISCHESESLFGSWLGRGGRGPDVCCGQRRDPRCQHRRSLDSRGDDVDDAGKSVVAATAGVAKTALAQALVVMTSR